MTLIAAASVTSTAAPTAFFDRWADTATWPQWNTDTEWVRLDGPFVEGATGALKPKGGPKVAFTVTRLVAEREFVDASRLLGARLTFAHTVTVQPDTRTRVDVEVTLTGLLAPVWRLILGGGIARSVQPDLYRLAAVAEKASVA